MKIQIVETGSTGNCYLLHSAKETLLVECGVSFIKIKKALNYNFDKINYCLVTHEHQDHCLCIRDVIKHGIKPIMSRGTFDEINAKKPITGFVEFIKYTQVKKTHDFNIIALNAYHNAAEPLSFIIHCKSTNERVLFAIDTAYIKWVLDDINIFLIECNYSKYLLEANISNGILNELLAAKIAANHMELETLKNYLTSTCLLSAKKIILIHTSSKNGDTELFQEEIERATKIPTFIGENGIIIK